MTLLVFQTVRTTYLLYFQCLVSDGVLPILYFGTPHGQTLLDFLNWQITSKKQNLFGMKKKDWLVLAGHFAIIKEEMEKRKIITY